MKELFEEKGTDGVADNPVAKLDALIQKAIDEKDISLSEATEFVAGRHPDLYAEYAANTKNIETDDEVSV